MGKGGKKVLGVIPARYHSTRLPEKLLLRLGDRSIIENVYEKALQAKTLDKVVIATDHQKIYDRCKNSGCEVVMTSDKHTSGTDRCAEVAASYTDYDLLVNIQGDEPFIDPASIDKLVEKMLSTGSIIGTLAATFDNIKSAADPSKVKVVFNQQNNAMYFSRSVIPYDQSATFDLNDGMLYHHIGVYAFHRKTLLELADLPVSKYEQIEKLEQLRWLDNGFNIQVVTIDYNGFGIDTIEDYLKAIEIWEAKL